MAAFIAFTLVLTGITTAAVVWHLVSYYKQEQRKKEADQSRRASHREEHAVL